MENELKISEDIKVEILKRYIEPSYTDDVNNLIRVQAKFSKPYLKF